ncbi:hypothetical protein ACU4GD_39605 [Cupriavidus basilensis]
MQGFPHRREQGVRLGAIAALALGDLNGSEQDLAGLRAAADHAPRITTRTATCWRAPSCTAAGYRGQHGPAQ